MIPDIDMEAVKRQAVPSMRAMTLRDYFAGQAIAKAMDLVEMDPRISQSNAGRAIAAIAYGIADDLLAERKKGRADI